MIVDRYYYNQLNDKEKKIYRAFYQGVLEHRDIIPLGFKGNISQESVSRIFAAIIDDNPLIYYVNQGALNVAQDSLGRLAFMPQYFFSAEKVSELNRKIQDSANKLAKQLRLTEGTELEKEMKVHDYFCKHVIYDHSGSDMKNLGRVIASHNIIGVLAQRKSQCEGIAKTVKLLLNAVDIRCIVVSGRAVNHTGIWFDHAWNMVNLGGIPYYLDVTWDIGATKNGNVSYDYFNVTTDQIKANHIPEGKLPLCEKENNNYFRMSKLVFTSKLMLKLYIEDSLKSGQKMLYFRWDGPTSVGKIADEMQPFVIEVLTGLGISAKLSRMVNEKMRTCRILVKGIR